MPDKAREKYTPLRSLGKNGGFHGVRAESPELVTQETNLHGPDPIWMTPSSTLDQDTLTGGDRRDRQVKTCEGIVVVCMYVCYIYIYVYVCMYDLICMDVCSLYFDDYGTHRSGRAQAIGLHDDRSKAFAVAT